VTAPAYGYKSSETIHEKRDGCIKAPIPLHCNRHAARMIYGDLAIRCESSI
jgi:hypothetical protein